MRQQRTACDRPRDDFRGFEDRAREDIQQILREAPDRRWITEQLMRIDVHPSVVTVAVIEVAVQHQHLMLLQLRQRAFTNFVYSSHGSSHGIGLHTASRASGFTNNVRPSTIVAATPPRSSHPSNGVFFERERMLAAWMRVFRSGASTVMSARSPGASDPPCRPRIRAGLTDISSTRRDRRITPVCTSRSSDSDTAVSSPTMPNGARSNSTFFSS